MGWQTASLGDICELYQPKTISQKEMVEDGDYPVFGANGVIGRYNKYNHDSPQLLITCRGATCGTVNMTTGKAWITGNAMVVSPKQADVDLHFLSYLLMGGVELNSVITGAAQPQITRKSLSPLAISYPSLEEQKRIVAILDQAFADIDKARALTEQNLKNARELFESYLQQVFSQRGGGWEVKQLEGFSTIVNGFAFKSGDFSSDNKVKSIKITNVGVYDFVEDEGNFLPEEFQESHNRYKAYEGDVVVALTRTIISSGLKVAVVPSSYDGALVNQRVAAVQVDEGVMPKEMLQAYLSTKMAIEYVKSNVNELMQPNLSIKDLKQFPVPVPPSGQVNKVMEQISEIRDSAKNMESIYSHKLNLFDELKKSLLQKAFSGELTKDKQEAA